jgi:hypothetical protein
LNIGLGKTSDLRDFEHAVFVGVRRIRNRRPPGLFTHDSVYSLPRMVQQMCQRQSCGRKQRVGERSRRTMARIVQANRQIAAQYKWCAEQHLCICTTRRSSSWMGYCSRRPHRVPLLSAKSKNRRAHDHQHWTISYDTGNCQNKGNNVYIQ